MHTLILFFQSQVYNCIYIFHTRKRTITFIFCTSTHHTLITFSSCPFSSQISCFYTKPLRTRPHTIINSRWEAIVHFIIYFLYSHFLICPYCRWDLLTPWNLYAIDCETWLHTVLTKSQPSNEWGQSISQQFLPTFFLQVAGSYVLS